MAFRFKSNQIIAAIVVIMYIQKYLWSLSKSSSFPGGSNLSIWICETRWRLIHSAEDQLMYSRYDSPPARAHASVRTQNVVCNWQHATNVF